MSTRRILFTNFPCFFCGDNRIISRFWVSGIAIGKCLKCGLMRTRFIPEGYEKYYTTGLEYHGQRYTDRYEKDLEVFERRLQEHLEYYGGPSEGSVLDVGCANGAFLARCYAHGLNPEGFEPNPIMAEWAQYHSGRPVYTEWNFAQQSFNMITYHDVIEHIIDPLAELRRARQTLTVGGLLVLDTPNEADLLTVGAHHLRPKEHLWYFGKHHIKETLKRAGFQVIGFRRPIPGKLVAYASVQFEGA